MGLADTLMFKILKNGESRHIVKSTEPLKVKSEPLFGIAKHLPI